MSIEKPLSSLLSSKHFFEKTASYHEHCPQNCGYNEKLNHCDVTPTNKATKKQLKSQIPIKIKGI